MLEYIKKIIRASGTTINDDEIQNLIDAAKTDLIESGVPPEKVSSQDPLVKQAIGHYVKGYFGLENKDDWKNQKSYESLLTKLVIRGGGDV